MMVLIGEMLGCLLVAAGIGVAAGWLLRHLTAAPIAQRLIDSETALRVKGQALDTARSESKMHTSALAMLEGKVASLENLSQSAQQELASRQERIDALQQELAGMMQRLSASESDRNADHQRVAEQEAAMAAYAKQAQQAIAAHTSAQQELLLKEQELAGLQQRLSDLDGPLAEIDRLRAQVADLEPAQGRVHWLEVQLSEKDAQHRGAIHQFKEQLAKQEHRIAELVQQEHVLLRERDDRIAALERRIEELQSLQTEFAGQAKMMGEKEEEISRLQKRLVEVRTALRVRADGGHVVARAQDPANQLNLQIGQSRPSNASQKDDLKNIRGIGPVIERALNRMGTYTYVQIAKWTAGDIARVAQKLEINPDRIKRDNWIAEAKKQHREKYGERI